MDDAITGGFEKPVVSVGDDLYGQSIAELTERIAMLKGEITRTEAALTHKRNEMSAAETLFGKPGGT